MQNTQSYQPKNEMPDLYRILGLDQNICQKENCDAIIKEAFNKKVKKYHPDKHPNRPEIVDVFAMIRDAYDILSTAEKREVYNNILSISKQTASDYNVLKKQSTMHMESLGEYKPPNQEQISQFEKQSALLNQQHNFDASQAKNPIPEKEAQTKFEELIKNRMCDVENLMPERLFEDEKVPPEIFNSIFDKYHNNDKDNTMMLHQGVPMAWNNTDNYGDYQKFGGLYSDDNSRLEFSHQSYGQASFGTIPSKNITKDDIVGLKPADYVKNHNVLGDDYYKDLKNRLNSRKTDTNYFESKSYQDYEKEKNNFSDYGIHDKLGLKMDQLAFDDADDIQTRYNKLMNAKKNAQEKLEKTDEKQKNNRGKGLR